MRVTGGKTHERMRSDQHEVPGLLHHFALIRRLTRSSFPNSVYNNLHFPRLYSDRSRLISNSPHYEL
jgi:hypothetical protein